MTEFYVILSVMALGLRDLILLDEDRPFMVQCDQ